METTEITQRDLVNAAQQLARSKSGRQSMRRVLAWLNDGGLDLHEDEKHDVLTLTSAAFGASVRFAATARGVIEETLQRTVATR